MKKLILGLLALGTIVLAQARRTAKRVEDRND